MNKLLKSKTFKIGLASGIVGIGIFGLTVGLSSTAKYNSENPRKKANDFAAKVSNLAFSLDAFDPNSDYKTVKNALLDNNNQIKNPDGVLKSFSFFQKNGENLEKINFEDTEFTSAKIKYHILEILPDDTNQNFKVKFQASQTFPNGDVAKSDIYEQTVAFAKKSNLLIAEFNFSLKKITDKLNQQVQNLLSTAITNFADKAQTSPTPNASTPSNKNAQTSTSNRKKDPSTFRAIDFQQDLNQAQSSQDLTKKLVDYFPALDNLLSKLNSSSENKLPNDAGNIFEFDFAKDKTTNQYVSVQNQVPSLFLEANLTTNARDSIGQDVNFKPIISAVRIQKKDKSSYFLDINDFVNNLELKNTSKTDFSSEGQGKTAYEFLGIIKSGYFADKNSRSEHTKSEINKLLKDKKLNFGFGKLQDKFRNHSNSNGLEYTFDSLKATIDKTDKSTILIPFTVSVKDSFFASSSSSNQVATKDGTLRLSGFKFENNKIELPSINQDIYKKAYLPVLEKGKEKQDLFEYGGAPRRSYRLIAQEEADILFKEGETKNKEIQKILADNYDYNFGPYISLLDSWTGKTRFPKLEDIKKLSRDEAKSTADKNVSAINSRDFFRDGHQVASFFQDLLTKDQKTILETLFELSKKWGIVDESAQFPEGLKNPKNNIFAEAEKIKNTKNGTSGTSSGTSEIKKLSFNGLWTEESGVGFYGTLVLPKEIKDKLKGDDSKIFEELKKESLLNERSFKPENPSTTNKKLAEGEKFENFADVLKAFFLKAAQFNNFAPWAKIDENLKYSFEVKKSNSVEEGKKDTVDNRVKELQEKITKTEGAQNQGKKAEGAQNQGKKAEGAQNQGKKSEGAQNQGKKAEGAQNQGKKSEGAQNQSQTENYLPVTFNFKLEYTDGSKSDFKTPELKMFLELEKKENYEKRKVVTELDKVVLKLQQEFRETSLADSEFDNLQFPKKSEGTPNQGKKAEGAQNQGKKSEGAQNQGKKAEGAQNQGKKAEGAQNQGKKVEGAQNQGKKSEDDVKKLSSYLSELGKKVEDYLNKNYNGKDYQTEVESVSESYDKESKALFFVLTKDEKSEGAQNQGKKAEGTPNQGKKSESQPKRSTLKVKIIVRKSKTADARNNNSQELKNN